MIEEHQRHLRPDPLGLAEKKDAVCFCGQVCFFGTPPHLPSTSKIRPQRQMGIPSAELAEHFHRIEDEP